MSHVLNKYFATQLEFNRIGKYYFFGFPQAFVGTHMDSASILHRKYIFIFYFNLLSGFSLFTFLSGKKMKL